MPTPKIVVLKGLPASGKTTYANQLLKQNSNSFRVNKDDLRKTLNSKLKWSSEREMVVVEIEHKIIQYLMNIKKDIIVDDTNLNTRHIKRYKELAVINNYEIDIVEMKTPIGECIKNDLLRKESVGSKVILDMAKRYNYLTRDDLGTNVNEFVIYFLEDVLCDSSIREVVTNNNNGVTGILEVDIDNILNLDKPIEKYTRKIQEDISIGYDVKIISTRPDYLREATLLWMNKYDVLCSELILRAFDSNTNNDVYKLETVANLKNIDLCKKIVDTELFINSIWKNFNVNKEIAS